jgi:DNA-binding IclR family transcriptional regulator
VAAIGITAAALRFPRSRIPEIARNVTDAAAQLSGRLGFHSRLA